LFPFPLGLVRLGRRPARQECFGIRTRIYKCRPRRSLSTGVDLICGCKPDSVCSDWVGGDGHLSARLIPEVSADRSRLRAGNSSFCSVLHRMGFVLPPCLRSGRWALTPPFHHHRAEARLSVFCDTFRRRLAFATRRPASISVSRVSRQACCLAESGLSSPEPYEPPERPPAAKVTLARLSLLAWSRF